MRDTLTLALVNAVVAVWAALILLLIGFDEVQVAAVPVAVLVARLVFMEGRQWR